MDNAAHGGFQIGDAVAVSRDGLRIPGVIEEFDGVQARVRLAQPWADESGQSTDSVLVPVDQLDGSLREGTGGTQALPG